jgi:hypothetical protein
MWILLVLITVLAVSGAAMYRMHGIFGSHNASGGGGVSGGADRIVPFNPKRVLYEVEGPAGTVGSLSYLDENAQPHHSDFTSLPWSLLVMSTQPSMFANLVAQGDSDTIRCRIIVNGEVREEQIANGHDAQTFCLVKTA